jgi:site-specific DNA-cytosine methylase
VLQAGVKVRRYVYIDNDDMAGRVARRHVRKLHQQFSTFLTTSTIKTMFSTLPQDIALVSAVYIKRLGPVKLVIAEWPCQGMSMAGKQNRLKDGRSSRFYDMVRVLRYSQIAQRCPPGYIIENVPVISTSRARTLEGMHRMHRFFWNASVARCSSGGITGTSAKVMVDQLGTGGVDAIGGQ